MDQQQLLRLSQGDEQAALDACVAALRGGGLVVIPTETVYGVGILPAHSEALTSIKPVADRPYSLAVDRADRLGAELAPLGLPARRLADRWWPGPLTQVLPDRRGGTIGVRVPVHAWTRRLLEVLGEPLLLSSANRPGEPAPASIDELSAHVREAVDVVVDGGRCEDGLASTVVAPGLAGLQLLREGAVSRADVEACGPGQVAVICSGNTCRSPMARALLHNALAQLQRAAPGLILPEIVSAGLHAGGGSPASPGALSAMAARGIDLAGHVSRALDVEAVRTADVLLGMTRSHVMTLLTLASEGQVVTLFDPEGDEVPDPFGGPTSVYEACATHLEQVALARARSLLPAGEYLP